MNEENLICYITICFFLIIRLKYFGAIQFFQSILSVFILISLGTVIFLVYDVWLSEKLTNQEVENLVDKTYKDINNITTLKKDPNVTLPEPSFPDDKKESDNNKKLIRNSLLVGLINTFVVLCVLYYIDKRFYHNLYKNIVSILILYTVELYFSWAIISDFKGEGLENVRHELVKKFIDA